MGLTLVEGHFGWCASFNGFGFESCLVWLTSLGDFTWGEYKIALQLDFGFDLMVSPLTFL